MTEDLSGADAGALRAMMDFSLADAAAVVRAPGPRDSKYTRGVVAPGTGSAAYPGAAVLSVAGAVCSGAGYVRYLSPGGARCENLVLSAFPEVVVDAPERFRARRNPDAWVLGSGVDSANALGDGKGSADSVDPRFGLAADLLHDSDSSSLIVLDGGLLDWFAVETARAGAPLPAAAQTVITPHAGELARILRRAGLADISAETIEENRGHWAAAASRALGCTVVLKGARTVIVPAPSASGAERNESGFAVAAPTHWLATAGSGDVLAGVIGTVLAQNHAEIRAGKLPIAYIAAAGVFLHGLAGGLASGTVSISSVKPNGSAGPITAAGQNAAASAGHPIHARNIADALPAAVGAVLTASLAQAKGVR